MTIDGIVHINWLAARRGIECRRLLLKRALNYFISHNFLSIDADGEGIISISLRADHLVPSAIA